jgi:hypothetical protein
LILVGIAVTAGCGAASNVVSPEQTALRVVMGASGYDWNVSVDGNYLGRLTKESAAATTNVAAGSHQLTFHDNSSGRDSYPADVYVPQGSVLQVTVAINGGTPVYWQ